MSEVLDPMTRPGATLALEVISDAICPWCWIGKRRLTRALAILGNDFATTVTWRAFELNPGTPKGGVDRRTYRIQKFGSWERSLQLDQQVAENGRSEGLEFRHDRMLRTPNTVDAHRVIWLADREGVQDAVVEALFVAYFTNGRDIGDAVTLAEVAASAGLARSRVEAMLGSDEGVAAVAAELDRGARLSISGVPTVLANGRPLFSGALLAEQIAARLRMAAG